MIYSLSRVVSKLKESDLGNLYQMLRLKPADDLSQTHLLEARLASVDHIAQALKSLTHQERQQLLQWTWQGRNDTLILVSMVGPSRHELITKLGHWGIVYQVQTHPQSWAYAIPHELVGPLLEVMVIRPSNALRQIMHAKSSPREFSESPVWWSLIHDLFMVLSHARRDPLQLTQEGQVYRRVVTKLGQKTWYKGQLNSVESAIYAANALGLLFPDANHKFLSVSPAAGKFWQLSTAEIFGLIEQFLATNYGMALQKLLWTLAGDLEPDQWLDLAKLKSWVQEQKATGMSVYNIDPLLNFTTELGLTEKNGSLLRLSDAAYWAFHQRCEPTESRAVVIQPTGEVLVPPNTSYRDRWIVDQHASPVKWDRMAVYRIDRESVADSTQRGISVDDYVSQWTQISRTKIPGNVEANIRDWYRALGRHRMVRATLIHSVDSVESHQVEQILGKSEPFLERLSPQDLIIADTRLEAVQKALDRAGIAMLPTIYAPGTTEHSNFASSGPNATNQSHLTPLDPPLLAVEVPDALLLATMDVYTVQRVLHAAIANNQMITVYFKEPQETKAKTITVISGHIAQGKLLGVDSSQQTFAIPLNKIVLVEPAAQ